MAPRNPFPSMRGATRWSACALCLVVLLLAGCATHVPPGGPLLAGWRHDAAPMVGAPGVASVWGVPTDADGGEARTPAGVVSGRAVGREAEARRRARQVEEERARIDGQERWNSWHCLVWSGCWMCANAWSWG